MGESIAKSLRKYGIAPEILQAYDFKVKKIKPVKAVFKLDTDKGPKLFKPFKDTEAKLLFIFSAMEHLVQRNFHQIAPFYLTKDGKPYQKDATGLYFVTDWIQGKDVEFQEPKQLEAATQTLANFHLASENYKPPSGSKVKNMWGKWPKKFTERLEELLNTRTAIEVREKKSAFDKLFLQHVDGMHRQGTIAHQILITSAYDYLVAEARQRKNFIHRDVAGRNFVHTYDGKVYMIDFDYARFDIRANDIVRLIERSMKKCHWDFNQGKAVLEIYHRVNPIKPEEYQVILAFLLYPQKFWRIVNRYYKDKKNWTEKEYLKKLNYVLKHSVGREKFAQEFAAHYCPEITW